MDFIESIIIFVFLSLIAFVFYLLAFTPEINESNCKRLAEANKAIKHTVVYPNCIVEYEDGTTETFYMSSN